MDVERERARPTGLDRNYPWISSLAWVDKVGVKYP